jgi:hypothetical protein
VPAEPGDHLRLLVNGVVVEDDNGPHTTVHNRYNRWSRRGFWRAMLAALAEAGWVTETAALDSTYVKAHRSPQPGVHAQLFCKGPDTWPRSKRRGCSARLSERSSSRDRADGRLAVALPAPNIPSRRMVRGWRVMAGKVLELRPKAAESEKITINLGYVDLGQIDLLVQEGFYSNPHRLHPDRHPQPARPAQ